jgi:hypothetical protein
MTQFLSSAAVVFDVVAVVAVSVVAGVLVAGDVLAVVAASGAVAASLGKVWVKRF